MRLLPGIHRVTVPDRADVGPVPVKLSGAAPARDQIIQALLLYHAPVRHHLERVRFFAVADLRWRVRGNVLMIQAVIDQSNPVGIAREDLRRLLRVEIVAVAPEGGT